MITDLNVIVVDRDSVVDISTLSFDELQFLQVLVDGLLAEVSRLLDGEMESQLAGMK
uniref:Uncharacterized protein n=1 Tax=viral metagenome TaxID=1070528 RepID=A0A6M3KW25_9ZZZZ